MMPTFLIMMVALQLNWFELLERFLAAIARPNGAAQRRAKAVLQRGVFGVTARACNDVKKGHDDIASMLTGWRESKRF
jgi:hypothetical protein